MSIVEVDPLFETTKDARVSSRRVSYSPNVSAERDIRDVINDYYLFLYGLFTGNRFYGGPQSRTCQLTIQSYLQTILTDIPNDFFPKCPSSNPTCTLPQFNIYSVIRHFLIIPANVMPLQ